MTRREIKRDPLLEWTSRTFEYLENNMWAIIGGVAAVVVLVAGGYAYSGWQDRSETLGMARLSELSTLVKAKKGDQVIVKADQIAASYGGRIEDRAKLAKADEYRSRGKFDLAMPIYKDIMGSTGDDEVHGYRATTGYADCLASQKKFADAGDLLAKWARGNAKNGLAPHALMTAAINFELAGKYQPAKKALDTIMKNYSKSQVVAQARARVRMIEGALAAASPK
jgi:predicted negative regulator of RcsB-dependent stress response